MPTAKNVNTTKGLYVALLMLLLLVFCTQSAMASFTLEDEKKLGKEFYEKLEKNNLILHNNRATAYLNKLGGLLLSHSDKIPFDFRFSIIRSAGINAFATPGGYVYVNQGLINLVENEGQLAGVLAHEIAHINGRHIAEMIERSQKINISTLAAIIAGAFLGHGGELTAAVTGFSLAAGTSLSLQYSREHEEAADRGGFLYLTASGFKGKYMLDFLKMMRRYEYFSNTVPSYFLTHPGTEERISYIDALLQTAKNTGGAVTMIGGLKRVQTLLLLQENEPSANLKYFREKLRDHPDDADFLYGTAVTEAKMGLEKESCQNFLRALQANSNDTDILTDFGISLFDFGKFREATAYLRKAAAADGENAEAKLYLAKALLTMGNIEEALALLKESEKRRPDDPEICYNLAIAYGKSSAGGLSHYYFGRYFRMKGKMESALFHFKKALNELPSGGEKRAETRKEMDSLKKPAKKDWPKESLWRNSFLRKNHADLRKSFDEIKENSIYRIITCRPSFSISFLKRENSSGV